MHGRWVVASGKLGARGWLLLLWRLAVDDCMFYLIYSDLQTALSSVPSNECDVIFCDFNIRVGSRGVDDGRWYEGGPHGYG